MSIIKFFRNSNIKKIQNIFYKYFIENYTINDDGSIDVDGDVHLAYFDLNKMPLKFRRVAGNFNCSRNYLTSLEGCPEYVGLTFDCSENEITSLEYGPKESWNYMCDGNHLLTLKGSPEYIRGRFICSNNKITSLQGSPFSIGDTFDFSDNHNLVSLKGGTREVQGLIINANKFLHFSILSNINYIKQILRYQDDYSIWNSDGTLNEYRFNEMIDEIKEEQLNI